MRSSTSSSNQRLPALRWEPMLGAALLLLAVFAVTMELLLARRGFEPATEDSEALWLEQRARASRLGERALILVGGSRVQLDTDLDLLRRRTGLEPVQLAIDGSSFRPVLAGLAADPAVRGTVLVDFADQPLVHPQSGDTAHRWQESYRKSAGRAGLPDFAWSERRLQQALRSSLRSYADGAQPLASLTHRILEPDPTPQYLLMRPDRSRVADYSKVDMPAFYYARVLRTLALPAPAGDDVDWNAVERELRAHIGRLGPAPGAVAAYDGASREIAGQARAIRERGGRVLFAMLPKSGLVREIEERKYPRARFWDRFAAGVGVPTAHYADIPAWRELECPDGSHVDGRQRAAFTEALVQAFALAR